MLKTEMEKMLNDQMNFEIYSAYIYLAMGAYFDSLNLPGFANWMNVQFEEEMFHAKKFYTYILKKGGRPFYTEIPAPGKEWESPKAAFEHALRHEQIVTGRIDDIKTAAIKDHDHATSAFIDWYVNEQVEEESNVEDVIRKLDLMKDSGHGLFMLNQELGARTFTPPVLVQGE